MIGQDVWLAAVVGPEEDEVVELDAISVFFTTVSCSARGFGFGFDGDEPPLAVAAAGIS